MARERRAYGEKSETDIIKDGLLDECAALVIWHRAQTRLAEIVAELAELRPEHEQLIGPASEASEKAGKAQSLWAAVNWKNERVEGKDLADLRREWQAANNYADRLWERPRLLGQRIVELESEKMRLDKIERPTLDVLSVLMEELQ